MSRAVDLEASAMLMVDEAVSELPLEGRRRVVLYLWEALCEGTVDELLALRAGVRRTPAPRSPHATTRGEDSEAAAAIATAPAVTPVLPAARPPFLCCGPGDCPEPIARAIPDESAASSAPAPRLVPVPPAELLEEEPAVDDAAAERVGGVATSPTERAILRALRDAGRPLRAAEVASGAATTVAHAQNTLAVLARRGLVARVERGSYELPAELDDQRPTPVRGGGQGDLKWEVSSNTGFEDTCADVVGALRRAGKGG